MPALPSNCVRLNTRLRGHGDGRVVGCGWVEVFSGVVVGGRGGEMGVVMLLLLRRFVLICLLIC